MRTISLVVVATILLLCAGTAGIDGTPSEVELVVSNPVLVGEDADTVKCISEGFCTIALGRQVIIQSTVQNLENKSQPFAFIVQIRDQDSTTIQLSWIDGELGNRQKTNVSEGWVPVKAGSYTIETFVWQSIEQPVVLSGTRIVDVLVSPSVSGAEIHCPDLPLERLKGVNFYDPVLMARESGYPWQTQSEYVGQHLAMIHSYGFNVIRVPYNWEAYVNNQENFLAEAELVASVAGENNICVFFDFQHWFTSSYFNSAYSGFPSFLLSGYSKTNNYKVDALPFWEDFWNNDIEVDGKKIWDLQIEFISKIIKRVDVYDSIIGYEILNEPHMPDNTEAYYEKLGRYNTYVANELRSETRKVIFFDREDTSVFGHVRNLDFQPVILPRVSNVVYAPHLYNLDSIDENIQGFKNLQKVWKEEGFGDIPVFIGEFALGPPYSSASQEGMDKYISTFSEAEFGWTYWAWGCFGCGDGRVLIGSDHRPTIYLEYLLNSMSRS